MCQATPSTPAPPNSNSAKGRKPFGQASPKSLPRPIAYSLKSLGHEKRLCAVHHARFLSYKLSCITGNDSSRTCIRTQTIPTNRTNREEPMAIFREEMHIPELTKGSSKFGRGESNPVLPPTQYKPNFGT
ncbi:hypothetical protein B0H11DRAFT_1930503 [Mycena galericulata]|nr:hypothetical protein B0H11DRAFT_1930503 [Mycena galericulata]